MIEREKILRMRIEQLPVIGCQENDCIPVEAAVAQFLQDLAKIRIDEMDLSVVELRHPFNGLPVPEICPAEKTATFHVPAGIVNVRIRVGLEDIMFGRRVVGRMRLEIK